MNSTQYQFSFSANDYKKIAESYVSSFDGKYAKNMKYIEDTMNIFMVNQYGYFPTAGEIEWPVLEPNFIEIAAPLVPFNEAWSKRNTDCIVHFYINDELFMRVFRNPYRYIPFLKQCRGVIGPDMSQYSDMPAEMRFRHAYCNVSLTSIFQKEGINMYPNVTWSKSDSYWYSYPKSLRNSIIAINSNGVHRNGLALYRWRQGYEMALRQLTPMHIMRYGQPVEGEVVGISSYSVNERLNVLRNGSKRK